MIKEIFSLFTFLISTLFHRVAKENESELYKEVLAAFESEQTQNQVHQVSEKNYETEDKE